VTKPHKPPNAPRRSSSYDPRVSIDRVAYFRDLVAEAPDEPRARYGLAVALRQAGEWPAAIEHYRAYLALATDEGAAYGHLAECLAATGDVHGAADAYLAGIDAAIRHGHNGLAADYEAAIEALG
jgi:Flp pilus assembly protein TadD